MAADPNNSTGQAGKNAANPPKVNLTAAQDAKVKRLIVTTKQILAADFPTLNAVPGAAFTAMKIWWYESSFELFHSKNFGSATNSMLNGVDSCHLSPQTAADSRLVKSYWESSPIVSIRNDPVKMGNADIVKGINQGRVAHGLSAIMGCYLVENTKPFNELSVYHAKMKARGVVVTPGNLISDVFPTNANGNYTGEIRSIFCGLMILDQKYKIYKSKGYSDSKALYMAVGAYVGFGRDANNYSGHTRQNQVYASNDTISNILASYSGVMTLPADQQQTVLAVSDSSVSSLGTGNTSSSPNTNRSPVSSNEPMAIEGCSKPV